jgi:glutamate-5-semialdehyde dehydrogenase
MATSVNPSITTREKLELARAAAPRVAQLFTAEKSRLLQAMANALEAQLPYILEANQKDLDSGGAMGAMRDRLLLSPERIAAMAAGLRAIAALPDPIGEVVTEWKRPNGLLIRKVRVPLGMIGII